jgi:DNA-binding IclR family transcriptional regulator
LTDDDVLAELHRVIKSVWALELLILLRRGSRAWRQDELVRELRSSDVAVGDALAGLQASGLVAADREGGYRYEPASPELDRLCGRIEALYAAKPLAVARAIMTAPNDKLRIFADAFRLKDPS